MFLHSLLGDKAQHLSSLLITDSVERKAYQIAVTARDYIQRGHVRACEAGMLLDGSLTQYNDPRSVAWSFVGAFFVAASDHREVLNSLKSKPYAMLKKQLALYLERHSGLKLSDPIFIQDLKRWEVTPASTPGFCSRVFNDIALSFLC